MVVLIARELKNVARSSGGLTRWFKENWVDVKTGKPCGRQKGEKRGYPACRPSKRVSSKTPKTTKEMSPAEKARFKRAKTGSKKITYQHRRKKKKLSEHSAHHSAKHMEFMKRRMRAGDTFTQAHKKAQAKVGK